MTGNPNMTKAIADGPYKFQALVPASPWLDNKAPASPANVSTEVQGDKIKISWTHPDEGDVFHWVVYYQYEGGGWRYTILNRKDRSADIYRVSTGTAVSSALTKIAVTAVDRVGNESVMKEITIRP